jgi:hypothetical protein
MTRDPFKGMHWDRAIGKHRKIPEVDAFIRDIIIVCKKHGMSLAHEDSQGAFIVEDYKADNVEWLEAAIADVRKKA